MFYESTSNSQVMIFHKLFSFFVNVSIFQIILFFDNFIYLDGVQKIEFK